MKFLYLSRGVLLPSGPIMLFEVMETFHCVPGYGSVIESFDILGPEGCLTFPFIYAFLLVWESLEDPLKEIC